MDRGAFSHYLDPVASDALVMSLGVGDGLELPHLRQFVGEKPRIHAFDILKKEGWLAGFAQYAGAKYWQQDIKFLKRVFRLAGGAPDLVVSRAPRILESVSRSEIKYNHWWIHTLTSYGLRSPENGQMLVTTYTKEEIDLLEKTMRLKGLKPMVGINPCVPSFLSSRAMGPE